MVLRAVVVFSVVLIAIGFQVLLSPVEPSVSSADRHFAQTVYPVLRSKCTSCHGLGSDGLKGGLDLTSRDAVMRGGESGEEIIVPGDPNAGLLIQAIRRTTLEMPPKDNNRLTDAQIKNIEAWIAAGAPWPSDERLEELIKDVREAESTSEGVLVPTSGGLTSEWDNRRYDPKSLWAYQPIAKPKIDPSPSNPIDLFIDAELQSRGLTPAAMADPLTLIRRVTFDVTGLPPKPDEIQRFLGEWQIDAEKAWSDLVDRLLSSPHYGEQAARQWLDVVRYADSSGFANDWQRPNAWRYRDYVVRAFNDDKPYDQFVREQIAGDEIDAHDPEMKVAVGMLRMGPWEHSFMSVATVSRQLFLDDVTDAIGQVFLAHPLQCARCHDHKFDPIPTQDYYALQAVFATTQLADVDAEWLEQENLEGMAEDQLAHERKRTWNESVHDALVARMQTEEQAWFREKGLPYESRAEALAAGLSLDQIPEHRVGLTPDELGRERIGGKWKRRFAWELIRYQPIAYSVYNGGTLLPKGATKPTPVPADPLNTGTVERTSVLIGGDPFSPGQPVLPGVLSAVNGGKQLRITEQPSGRRSALAEWLVHPSNPLPARVKVNRLWQSCFGVGLVRTPNNFGAMGAKPTHPELLDYLAAHFIESNWSIKQLRRLILTSQTYRRSSYHPDIDLLERMDPNRHLYAVFLPRRLTGEELRDAMLSASSELNPTLGGIPARPDFNIEAALQPRLIMGSFAPSYVPNEKPQQRNRRTLYALKLRGLRDPFMEVFDQPSPDNTCELREQSNVTTQVFALLNGQESLDRALALANRIISSTASREEAIDTLFWTVYGRAPAEEEIAATVSHWQQMESVQAAIVHQPYNYPAKVSRQANEENSGQVFEFVERLFEYEHYVPDLQPHEVDARTRALADICLMLFNSNEFVYVY